MKLTDMNFLKTSEVKGGEIITFLTEGEWVKNTKFTYENGDPKNDFVIKVEILEVEKSMRLSKVNRETLKAAFGDETAEWIGKQAKITKVKAMIGGKMQDMIILETV